MIDENVIEEILKQPEFEGFHYEEIIGCGGFATVAKITIDPDKTIQFKDYEKSSVENYYALKVIDIHAGYIKYKDNRWKGNMDDYQKCKVNPEYEKIKTIPSMNENYAHIVPIIRHQQVSYNNNSYLCLLMPYFPSSSQSSQGRYEDEMATIDFALQVSDGLSTMHKNGLIHRDLKPVNILEVIQNFKPIYKISDLGGIRQIKENQQKGNTSVILISGNYTAPESTRGIYSIQSDIYSLGMCIARFRFKDSNDCFDELVKKGVLDNYIEWPDYYSEGLQTIIRKCIQYYPKNRYNSVSEIIKDLLDLKTSLEKNTELAQLQQKIEDYKLQLSMNEVELSKKEKRIKELVNEIKQKEDLMNVIVVNEQKNREQIETLINTLNNRDERIKELEAALQNTKIEKERALNKANINSNSLKNKVMDLNRQLENVKKDYEKLLRPKPLPRNPEFERMNTGEVYSRTLGNYEGHPIEWMVLDKDEQTQSILLMSKDILFKKAFHNKWESVSWQTSDLHNYLNTDFYNQAFTKEEKERINITQLSHSDNLKYGTEGGNNTKDRIFLLSVEEMEKYFKTNQDMISKRLDNNSVDSYWLRTPGLNEYNFTRVFNIGGLDEHGSYVDNEDGVRPALWVRI